MARSSIIDGICRLFQQAAESPRVRKLEDELAAAQAEIGTLKVELARAKEQATTDDLTGIANRKGLHKALNSAINRLSHEKKGTFALLLFDLNGFKPVNDTYGHSYGDECLKEIAKRLGVSVRASDTVGRLGGDEFVIVAYNTTQTVFAAHFHQLCVDIFAPITLSNGQTVQVGCSFGVVEYDRSQQPQRLSEEAIASTTLALIQDADDIMYKMKNEAKEKAAKEEAAKEEAAKGETNGANQQGSLYPPPHSHELKRA